MMTTASSRSTAPAISRSAPLARPRTSPASSTRTRSLSREIWRSAPGRTSPLGPGGGSFDNDVRAGGSITVTAGRDFTIDGFADLAADDTGGSTGGGVTILAGRDILEDAFGDDAS